MRLTRTWPATLSLTALAAACDAPRERPQEDAASDVVDAGPEVDAQIADDQGDLGHDAAVAETPAHPMACPGGTFGFGATEFKPPVVQCHWDEGQDVMSTPVVLDITGDGKPEIIFPSYKLSLAGLTEVNTVLRAISGTDCTPLWATPIEGLGGEIAAGDLDGDGVPEIVVHTERTGTVVDDPMPTVSWSPDGRWLAFVSAPVGGGGGGSALTTADSTYDTPNARLRLISIDGGPIYELGRATQGVGHTSTWPKFAPFTQGGGQLFFLTFSSKIDYGFALKNDAAAPDARIPQLWMSAVDLRRLEGGGDPSSAPVWLPFQDTRQHNHLPYWTEAIACRTATSPDTPTGCADDELCMAGFCQQR